MQSVPGVSIRTSGPGMTEFEMRGVASNGGNSPTVGFYFDETALTAPAATNEGKIVISPDSQIDGGRLFRDKGVQERVHELLIQVRA
jgi:hypothetical protein